MHAQVSGEGEFFADMVVEAVSKLDPQTLDMSLLGIKKVHIHMYLCMQGAWKPAPADALHAAEAQAVCACSMMRCKPESERLGCRHMPQVQGGGLRDSFLVDGVAFKKTFSYAGFEMQPKSYEDPRVLLLNIELELKSEKENAEVRGCCSLACTSCGTHAESSHVACTPKRGAC